VLDKQDSHGWNVEDKFVKSFKKNQSMPSDRLGSTAGDESMFNFQLRTERQAATNHQAIHDSADTPIQTNEVVEAITVFCPRCRDIMHFDASLVCQCCGHHIGAWIRRTRWTVWTQLLSIGSSTFEERTMTSDFKGSDSPRHHDFDDTPEPDDPSNVVPKVAVQSLKDDTPASIELTLDDFGGRSDSLGG
jgi:hypothetical protein